MVLPHSDVIRLFFLQRLEKQIQRGLEIVVVLFRPAVLDHGEHHFHGLLIGRRLMEKVEHKGRVEGDFGFLPKGIVLAGVLRRGILDEVVYQPEHVGVLADIAERVIAVGMARLDQIEHLDDIALLQKKRSDSPDKLALRIGADKAGIGKEKIRLHNKAGFACAAAADHDLKQVSHVLPPVKAHAQVLGEDHVPGRIFVAVLFVQFPDAAPAGRAVFLAGASVHTRGIIHSDCPGIDHQSAQREFDGVRRPAQGKGLVHSVGKDGHELKEIHAVLIDPGGKHSEIQHGHGKRRPQWGGVPERLLVYIGIPPKFVSR